MSLQSPGDSFRHNLIECPFPVEFIELDESVTVPAGGVQPLNSSAAERGKVVAAVVDLTSLDAAEVAPAIMGLKGQLADCGPQLAFKIFLVRGYPEIPEELSAVCVPEVGGFLDTKKQFIEAAREFKSAKLNHASDGDGFVKKTRPTIERTVVPEELFVGKPIHTSFLGISTRSLPQSVRCGQTFLNPATARPYKL